MPIIGMTDRAPAFPSIGVIRKGAPKETTAAGKTKPGRDLPYFRIDTADKSAAEILEREFGKEPRTLRVHLMHETALENFDPYREEWKAGGLLHRCDGEDTVLYYHNGAYHDDPRRCPYADLPEREKLCKPVGRLAVFFRELNRAVTMCVQTTSKNDIVSLWRSLSAAELQANGNLAGVPFLLTRRPVMVSCPGQGDTRVRREKNLLFLEIDPGWWQRRLAHTVQLALPPKIEEIEGDPMEPDENVIEGEIEEPRPSKRRASSKSPSEQAAELEPPGFADGEEGERPSGPPESAPGIDRTRQVQLDTIGKFAALKRVSAEGHAVGLFDVGIAALNTTQLSALIKHLGSLPAPDEVSTEEVSNDPPPAGNTQDSSLLGDQALEPGLFSTEAEKFKEADRLLAKLAATGYFGKGAKAAGAWLLKNHGSSELVNLRGPKLDLVLNQLLDLDAAGVGASAGA
jgi:hypothetical protein